MVEAMKRRTLLLCRPNEHLSRVFKWGRHLMLENTIYNIYHSTWETIRLFFKAMSRVLAGAKIMFCSFVRKIRTTRSLRVRVSARSLACFGEIEQSH